MDKQTIFIIAGEPSADLHGAALVKALHALKPDLRIAGIGGCLMREAGAELFADLTPYAVIGFVEVIKHVSIFKKTFQLTLDKIRKNPPQAVILIDYPGFNLRLAQRIKNDFPQVKIIYYISPQVWAWGKKRISLIKRVVDKMLVVFDFEAKLYEQHNVDVEFVGHPLMENIAVCPNKTQAVRRLGFSEDNPIIAILPGSRVGEIHRILPVMLKAARQLRRLMPSVQFALLKAPNIPADYITRIISDHNIAGIRVIDRKMHDVLSASSFAWVCSGTATLETAILEVPLLIVYKTSFVTWLISRMLINLPYIGLVNVVAGKKIVPELIQYRARPENIVKITQNFLSSGEDFSEKTRKELRAVKQKLGDWQASKKAAYSIIRAITE